MNPNVKNKRAWKEIDGNTTIPGSRNGLNEHTLTGFPSFFGTNSVLQGLACCACCARSSPCWLPAMARYLSTGDQHVEYVECGEVVSSHVQSRRHVVNKR